METALVKEFLMDSYKFTTRAAILHVAQENEKYKIKLSRTVFHPQGGGQPSDTGFIRQGSALFQVDSAEHDRSDENIWHLGQFQSEIQFSLSEEVDVEVDGVKRLLNARLHSAGHLLDIAMDMLGYQLKPGKGYHFPSGAYVEYIGNLTNEEKDAAIPRINEICAQLINNTAEEVSVGLYEYDEAQKHIEVPAYMPEGKPMRIVKLTQGDKGCPCGGTHVKHVRDIAGLEVYRIQKKGKNTRVSYKVI
jgi:Ser-tRNA(Ala) deacylase AlaX